MRRFTINIIFISLCLIGMNNTLFCQTVIIFQDDSLQEKFFLRNSEEFLKHPIVDLKEKLPDGEYMYVWLNKKDSVKKDLKDYVVVKGHYKDSLRHGRFEYYVQCNVKRNKQVNKLVDVYNYKNGQLNGDYFSANCGYILHEGYYKEGKRHGFFISYEYDRKIRTIELFEHDTLKQWARYYKGILTQSGYGDFHHLNGEYITNDTLGNLKYKGYFENGNLIKLYYYQEGKIVEESTGQFRFCFEGRHWIGTCSPPINGIVKKIDLSGNIIKTEKYQNGELVN